MATKTDDYNSVPLKEVDEEKREVREDSTIELKPKMSLLNGVTVIVGSIIGSGIFISPGGVLMNTGSVGMALTVWLASGIFSMVGAYCYAELGCMIRKTGGDYAYVMETFGGFLAFMRLYVESMIIRPCTVAIVALSFAVYSVKYVFPECEPPDEAVRLLAAICIAILTFVNCWDVNWATTVQDVFTYAKLLALFVIIGTGLIQLGRGKTENFNFEDTETDFSRIMLSFYSGLFAYNGWNYLNFIIEELQDPVRNLPRAISFSIILVTIVYLFTNVAFFTTLSVPEVLGSEAVASTFAKILYGPFAICIPIFVAMSCFGGVNGILLTSARLFYAGGLEGQMPEVLSMIQSKKMTPAPAVLFSAFLSFCYLCSSNIYALMDFVGFATWLAIGLGVLCIPVLRYQHPEWERPIKVNMIFPILYIIASIMITVVPMMAEPMNTAYGTGMIMTGVPVYFICIYWKNKPMWVSHSMAVMTDTMQKLLLVLPKD